MVDNLEKINSDVRDFKAPIDFKDLDISKVDPFESSETSDTLNYHFVVPVQIEGMVYNMLFKVNISNDEKHYLKWRDVSISIFDKEHNLNLDNSKHSCILNAEIGLNFPDVEGKGIKAWTSIERIQENAGDFPKGIGIELYKKMLDFISQQAEIYKTNIFHEVMHDENMGLSEEKWLKEFGPILEKYGYNKLEIEKNDNGQKWGKTYVYTGTKIEDV